MARECPVYQRCAFEVGGDGIELPCQARFGVDEIYLGQESVRVKKLLMVWAYSCGELLQDADDLAAFLPFQLADAVVGFHHFGGFDEHGATCGGLVVDDALDFPFQGRGHGDDEASVAHGGGHVLVHDAALLRVAEDAVQGARDAAFHRGQFAADAEKLGGRGILYFSITVENPVNAAHDLREHGDAFRQAVQGGIRAVVAFRPPVRFLFVPFVQELHDGDEGGERAFQVEQLVLVQVGAFHADAPDGRAHVVEVLDGELLFPFQDLQELPGLFLPFAEKVQVGHELHLSHFLLPERAEAVSGQHAAYLVESYLLLEILRVNHASCGFRLQS